MQITTVMIYITCLI